MALASGTYRIHSAYGGDGRYVQNNSGLLQLELLDHGTSNDQKFQVTLTSDGTHAIRSLTAGSNSGIWASGSPAVGPLVVYDNGGPVRWKIQQAPDDPNALNIIAVHAISDARLRVQQLWNRIDPDDQGRLQLMDPGPQDPHNNWYFEAV
jgi:hypothetical protein